jgi:hypothetical protein
VTKNSPIRVRVDAAKVLRAVEPRIIGMNSNYILDHQKMRAAGQGYTEGLRQMGVKCLRYPGGEKSDSYLWAAPPHFKKPQPSLARIGGTPGKEWPSPIVDLVKGFKHFVNKPLDFDQFMAICQELGAEPILVVCFDCMYKPAPPGGWRADKKTLMKAAVEWVRYANVVKKYGVRYWEIGNESYLNTYNGGCRPEEYARDLADFSRAMKKVDPSILIGANGPHGRDESGQLGRAHGVIWWEEVLKRSAAHIDWLTVHPYPCWEWGSYDWYRLQPTDFTEAARGAIGALKKWAPKHAKRIRIAATELNSADWSSGGWAFLNNLGHALVLFDMLGEHLLIKELDHAAVWNTRWVSPKPASLWDSLDPQNRLNPTGVALSIWSRFLKDDMVKASAGGPLKAYASAGKDGSFSLFVINRELHPQKALLPKGLPKAAWCYSGKGPDDFKPTLKKAGLPRSGQATLPPVSLTIFEYPATK